MINYRIFLFFTLGFCFLTFVSCDKENMDDITIDEEENPVVVVNCDGFAVAVSETDGTLTASSTGGETEYAYEWSTGETTASITATESGTYTVTATDAQECTATTSIEVTLSVACSNSFALNAPDLSVPLDFMSDGAGLLFQPTCSAYDNYPSFQETIQEQDIHTYVIVDANWNGGPFDLSLPYQFIVPDGVPVILFETNGPAQAGDVIDGVNYEPQFFDPNTSEGYIYSDIQITIESASEEVGGEISGSFSGTISGHNFTGAAPVSGSFCVALTNICE